MRLLLAEDNRELAHWLEKALVQGGFAVDCVFDGRAADHLLQSEKYALAVLDIGMPGLDGLEVVQRLRKRGQTLPVLLLTARSAVADRVKGLNVGADDYLPKPFNDRELVARIKAILRRVSPSESSQNSTALPSEENTLEFCGLVLHSGLQQASYKGQDLGLTGSEFALLHKLILRPGQIVSREELSMNVLGKHLSPFDRSIDMHMSNLRKKLPERDNGLPWLKTLRSRGYLLVCE